MTKPILVRIMEKVERRENGCWDWKGSVSAGRPHVFVEKVGGKARTALVARVMYELHNEDPGDLHVHHVCMNGRCVNPAHLIAVPGPEHYRIHRPTHCPAGHPYANHCGVRKNGTIFCRRCDYLNTKAWRRANPDKHREQQRRAAARRRDRAVRL